MTQQKAPSFSQNAMDSRRKTKDFEAWNRNFESLRRAIRIHVSPRDVHPIARAGAEEETLISLLAWVVYDQEGLSPQMMNSRRALKSAAQQLSTVANHVARVVNDPQCDGRFWLALVGGLSWDFVPTPGRIESPSLNQMRALAELLKERGAELGKNARMLAKLKRTNSLKDLVRYANYFAKPGKNFDSELTYLLDAAQRAAKKWEPVAGYRKSPKERMFTIEQIKKFRQRNFPAPTDQALNTGKGKMIVPAGADPNPSYPAAKPMTIGQRMTQSYLRSPR